MMISRLSKIVTILAIITAFAAITLGAYTRLQDAGLGCPDWPGCYGQITVPETQAALEQAQADFPGLEVSAPKAWLEMIHRYIAGSLAVLIFALGLIALENFRNPLQPLKLPMFLWALVIFQAMLGMWTVTLKLYPVVVIAHLLGGFATLSLLWWHALKLRINPLKARKNKLKYFAFFVLTVLIAQIALGGWTSSNYAAMVCPDFPYCQACYCQSLISRMHSILGSHPYKNYEGGVLTNDARITIHMMHRIGAIVTASLVLIPWLSVDAEKLQ